MNPHSHSLCSICLLFKVDYINNVVIFLLVCCGDAAVAAAVVVVSIQGTKLYGPVNHCQI